MNITDADREAAAQYLPLADEECGECERGLMRAGEMDDHWLVRFAARHRLRGYNAGLEAAAAYVQANYPHDKRALVPGIRAIDPATVGETE